MKAEPSYETADSTATEAGGWRSNGVTYWSGDAAYSGAS